MNTSPDPLDELLDRWNPPPVPPNLAWEVRHRLAAAPRPATTAWWARLDVAFARPSFAAAFVAACTLFGLFLAEARLSRLHAEQSARLVHSYLQAIDPLVEDTPAAQEAPKP